MKSIYLIFSLSMPNRGSWDGKWTGEKDYHAIVINFTQKYGTSKTAEAKLQQIFENESYYYNFGDGWCARVFVFIADKKEAAKAKNKSTGFCGYDWMVDSILQHGKILNSHERAVLA